jgi:hypothetical protein
MQEVAQLLDIVEAIYAGDRVPWRNDHGALIDTGTGPALAKKSPPPGHEFSPLEETVLTALAEHPEIDEAELGKLLAERGATGVLIKAIVGDIIRKTGALGLPWVEVCYVQGRFRYRLRSAAVPKTNSQRVEIG